MMASRTSPFQATLDVVSIWRSVSVFIPYYKTPGSAKKLPGVAKLKNDSFIRSFPVPLFLLLQLLQLQV